MLPIFKEYCDFIAYKTGLQLEEGYYWYDNSIIKGFDNNGNPIKLYRINIKNDLSMQITRPKGYPDISKIAFILLIYQSWKTYNSIEWVSKLYTTS